MAELSQNKLLELDKKLLILALSDFNAFCQITGVDRVQAYICMEKARGKSNGVIATSLNVTRQAVHARSKKCKCAKSQEPKIETVK